MIVIDKACQSDNFSSLPTLPCRPIMCSILIIAPADWTANRPIVLACIFTAYFSFILFIAYFISFAATFLRVTTQKCINCLCANLATKNFTVRCAYFAVNGQNEALIGRKYQFSSNMFPLPTT